jgi:hypothetical protein
MPAERVAIRVVREVVRLSLPEFQARGGAPQGLASSTVRATIARFQSLGLRLRLNTRIGGVSGGRDGRRMPTMAGPSPLIPDHSKRIALWQFLRRDQAGAVPGEAASKSEAWKRRGRRGDGVEDLVLPLLQQALGNGSRRGLASITQMRNCFAFEG